MRTTSAIALVLPALAACGGDEIVAPAPVPGAVHYNEAWEISTHNSYWVNRGVPGDLFASGVEERISDQLLFDHARGLEIDIHRDPAEPHAFAVYHTEPGNVLCGSLAGCLGLVRAFHHALPRHEPLQITIELKELIASNFDEDHTVEDLDRALTDELGGALYRPADLLARCGALPRATSLTACVAGAGWPAVDELRGKILVAILGNWDGLPGARGPRDWADYALHGDLRDRAAFPMASSWQRSRDDLTGPIHQLVTQEQIDAAFLQAPLLQIEDLADPALAPFLARGGVARIDGAFSMADQDARIALGAELLQSDTPWIQTADRGPEQPLRGLSPTAPELVEPGARLVLHAANQGERVFAYAEDPPGAPGAWETTVSSGIDARAVGCLRVASRIGPEGDSLTACRTKIAAIRGDAKGSADAERMILRVTACHAGTCSTKSIPSIDPEPGGPGDTIGLEVSRKSQGSTCVRVLSASAAKRDFTPDWADAGEECFLSALPYRGIARPAPDEAGAPAVMFFGTRRGGVDLGAKDLAHTAVEPATGAIHEEPALLEDRSSP